MAQKCQGFRNLFMHRHFVRFVLRVPPQNSFLRAGLRPFILLTILARTILNRVQNIVKMVFDICFQYNFF